MTVRRELTAALIGAGALASAGCGGDEASDEQAEVTVSAAASLAEAFTAYGEATPADERFSFAGSDELAAQIRQGAPADVYAAANTELPELLFEEGLVEEPVVFTANRLVLAVPEGSEIGSLEDLAEPDVDLVIGTEDVPFGAYTRTVLDRLPAERREAIIANVRSEESDVKAAVGKLTQGAADASFTYVSDVVASGGRIEAIELPEQLQPDVAYAVAVVEGAEDPQAARGFIDGLLEDDGAQALEDAGFESPPGG